MRIDVTDPAEPVAACFERTARLDPARVAVICRLGEITYGELNKQANRLAHRLLQTGGPGDRVALLMPQDQGAFVAMLATLKTGRIVLFLNKADPPARLSQLLGDAEPSVILTVDGERALAESVAGPAVEVINLDDLAADGPADNPASAAGPDDTAFFVYTSGSTGRPKAVMQTHGHTLRDANNIARTMAMTPEDRVVLLSSLWGAQAINTTWTTFASGATLVSFPAAENGVTGLAESLTKHRVSIYISAASLFRYFIKGIDGNARFPHVRFGKLSADAAMREDFVAFHKHFPNGILMNAMGGSEVGHLTYKMFPRDAIVAEGRLPVGRPFDNIEVRILDEDGKDCPPGVVGNISARIEYLAAGYWRDPEMTAQCFFEDADGMRIFRGGDLAYRDADGGLTLAGRKDATYKVRGQRVDIAEAEQAVAALPGVSGAAVVASPWRKGELQLVAYLVPSTGAKLTSRKIRTAARALMPRHLVPSIFVFVEALPLTANGKVDRGALRDRAAPSRSAAAEPPRTETETLLIGLWEAAFDLDGLTRSDDFFELGGDSLIASVIAAHLHAVRHIAVDFGTFIDHPQLSDLATIVDKTPRAEMGEEEPQLVPIPRDQPIPIALVQELLSSDSRNPRHSTRHTRTASGRIEGPLNIEILRQSLDDVFARHEILRTCFRTAGDSVVQVVQPPAKVPLPLVDLSGLGDGEERLAALIEAERVRFFDLAGGPPIAFTLVKLRGDCHVLIQSSHHILTDGPSWKIFLSDLGQIYEARLAGGEPPLVPLAVQYADYSVWDRELWRRNRARLDRTVTWWATRLTEDPPPVVRWLEAYRRRTPARNLSDDDGQIGWGLDAGTSERLDAIGENLAATYFIVRLATVVPVLVAATGHDKVAITVIFTNRTRVELEPMFGAFANLAPVVVGCRPGQTFRDHVRGIREHILELRPHAEIPYPLVVAGLRERGVEFPPNYFAVHMPTPIPPRRFGGLDLTWSDSERYPPTTGIQVRFDENRERDGCSLIYNASIYPTPAMEEFLDRLKDFTVAAAGNPDATIEWLFETSGVADAFRHRADSNLQPRQGVSS